MPGDKPAGGGSTGWGSTGWGGSSGVGGAGGSSGSSSGGTTPATTTTTAPAQEVAPKQTLYEAQLEASKIVDKPPTEATLYHGAPVFIDGREQFTPSASLQGSFAQAPGTYAATGLRETPEGLRAPVFVKESEYADLPKTATGERAEPFARQVIRDVQFQPDPTNQFMVPVGTGEVMGVRYTDIRGRELETKGVGGWEYGLQPVYVGESKEGEPTYQMQYGWIKEVKPETVSSATPPPSQVSGFKLATSGIEPEKISGFVLATRPQAGIEIDWRAPARYPTITTREEREQKIYRQMVPELPTEWRAMSGPTISDLGQERERTRDEEMLQDGRPVFGPGTPSIETPAPPPSELQKLAFGYQTTIYSNLAFQGLEETPYRPGDLIYNIGLSGAKFGGSIVEGFLLGVGAPLFFAAYPKETITQLGKDIMNPWPGVKSFLTPSGLGRTVGGLAAWEMTAGRVFKPEIQMFHEKIVTPIVRKIPPIQIRPVKTIAQTQVRTPPPVPTDYTVGGYVDWTTNRWMPQGTVSITGVDLGASRIVTEVPKPSTITTGTPRLISEPTMIAHPSWAPATGGRLEFTVPKITEPSLVRPSYVDWATGEYIRADLTTTITPKPSTITTGTPRLLSEPTMIAHPSWAPATGGRLEFTVPRITEASGWRPGYVDWATGEYIRADITGPISPRGMAEPGAARAWQLTQEPTMAPHPTWYKTTELPVPKIEPIRFESGKLYREGYVDWTTGQYAPGGEIVSLKPSAPAIRTIAEPTMIAHPSWAPATGGRLEFTVPRITEASGWRPSYVDWATGEYMRPDLTTPTKIIPKPETMMAHQTWAAATGGRLEFPVQRVPTTAIGGYVDWTTAKWVPSIDIPRGPTAPLDLFETTPKQSSVITGRPRISEPTITPHPSWDISRRTISPTDITRTTELPQVKSGQSLLVKTEVKPPETITTIKPLEIQTPATPVRIFKTTSDFIQPTDHGYFPVYLQSAAKPTTKELSITRFADYVPVQKPRIKTIEEEYTYQPYTKQPTEIMKPTIPQPAVMPREAIIQKERLDQPFSYETRVDVIPREDVIVMPDVAIVSATDVSLKPIVITQQESQSALETKLQPKLDLELKLDLKSDLTFGYGGGGRLPPPPEDKPFKGAEDPFKRKKKQLSDLEISEAKSLYADLISVMQSELEFGEATSESLIEHPEAWSQETNLFGKVMTAEQRKYGKGKNPLAPTWEGSSLELPKGEGLKAMSFRRRLAKGW